MRALAIVCVAHPCGVPAVNYVCRLIVVLHVTRATISTLSVSSVLWL